MLCAPFSAASDLNKQEEKRSRQKLTVWKALKRSININAETTTKFLSACNTGACAHSVRVECLDALLPSGGNGGKRKLMESETKPTDGPNMYNRRGRKRAEQLQGRASARFGE